MNIDKIKIAKVRENAIIPSKRDGDGCYDIYANIDDRIVIKSHCVALVPTGICSTFDNKYRVAIRERGSNTKSGLITMAGQIDSNYTGEWFVALYNINDVPVEITNQVDNIQRIDTPTGGEVKLIPASKAIAQFAVEYVPDVEVEQIPLKEIQELKTERGTGCLGSSGK